MGTLHFFKKSVTSLFASNAVFMRVQQSGARFLSVNACNVLNRT